ncbi:phosphatase PAP2 family protein [Sesbania bispinosa]|nr:phosphatase PAP2 family protein [Sesbania bispinosa]
MGQVEVRGDRDGERTRRQRSVEEEAAAVRGHSLVARPTFTVSTVTNHHVSSTPHPISWWLLQNRKNRCGGERGLPGCAVATVRAHPLVASRGGW